MTTPDSALLEDLTFVGDEASADHPVDATPTSAVSVTAPTSAVSVTAPTSAIAMTAPTSAIAMTALALPVDS